MTVLDSCLYLSLGCNSSFLHLGSYRVSLHRHVGTTVRVLCRTQKKALHRQKDTEGGYSELYSGADTAASSAAAAAAAIIRGSSTSTAALTASSCCGTTGTGKLEQKRHYLGDVDGTYREDCKKALEFFFFALRSCSSAAKRPREFLGSVHGLSAYAEPRS